MDTLQAVAHCGGGCALSHTRNFFKTNNAVAVKATQRASIFEATGQGEGGGGQLLPLPLPKHSPGMYL